jgi:hypothetical protein
MSEATLVLLTRCHSHLRYWLWPSITSLFYVKNEKKRGPLATVSVGRAHVPIVLCHPELDQSRTGGGHNVRHKPQIDAFIAINIGAKLTIVVFPFSVLTVSR